LGRVWIKDGACVLAQHALSDTNFSAAASWLVAEAYSNLGQYHLPQLGRHGAWSNTLGRSERALERF